MHDQVADTMRNSYKFLPRFKTVNTFWMGANYDTNDKSWHWIKTKENFNGKSRFLGKLVLIKELQLISDFTKWEVGEADIGCSTSGCKNDDGLVLRAAYSTSADTVSMNWNGLVNKNLYRPYICQSDCPRSYFFMRSK